MSRGQGKDTIEARSIASMHRRASGIIVHAYAGDRFFSEPPAPLRLGGFVKAAAIVGRQAHAVNVRIEYPGNVWVYADEHGVHVDQLPDDMPFMEHPEYNAPPRRRLVDNTPIAVAAPGAVPKRDVLDAVYDLVAATHPRRVRIKLQDKTEACVNYYDISIRKRVPRRLIGSKWEIIARRRRPDRD